MSQPPSSPPSQQVSEGIELSGIPKNHPISADQAESSIHNADTDLCPRCLSIEPEIQELLSLDPRSIWELEHTGLELKSADDLCQSPSCPLCQALKFICPKIWFTDRCPARLVVFSATDNGGGSEEETQYLCLTLAYLRPDWSKRREKIEIFDARELPQIKDAIGCIAEKPALEKNPGTAFANSIPALVDFKLLQKWLKSSEREEDLIGEANPIRNLMVIDCESREIIKAPSAKYVALSYVWGQQKQKEGELEEIEGRLYLKRPLEKTIEDALSVTKQLSLRYLWVDRYCIPQNDLKYQISKMHEIYGGAHVTIIAAAGNGPQHGLPGVDQTRRIRPPPVTIGSRTLLATFPSPKLLVEESKWHSRGWTFQEGLLSRRQLVFTDHQVFFHSDSFIFFEAFRDCFPRGINLRRELYSPFGPLFSFSTAENSRQLAPWERIAQYCNLDLTNPEDTVNAILGVLNYYQEGIHRPSTVADARLHPRTAAIRHITGLPISRKTDSPSDHYETWEDAIIYALSWKSKAPADRRKPERMPFPSWSWAGWKCDCYFDGMDSRSRWDSGAPHLPSSRGGFDSVRSQNGCLPSILIETEEPQSLLQATEYETMFDKKHDFSKIRYLHFTALTVVARIVMYDNDRLDESEDWLELDNTGRKLALECSGAENPAFLNLTSNSIYQQPVPLFDHPCLAVILYDDPQIDWMVDGPPWTCLLVVGKIEDCYERIGIAHIRREALSKAHVKKQEDIKLG